MASLPDEQVVQLPTVPKVAERLRVSPSAVSRLIGEGERDLPSVKVGGSRRVTIDQLNQYVERLESEAR
jgi:excisionase family DNA binding protein